MLHSGQTVIFIAVSGIVTLRLLATALWLSTRRTYWADVGYWALHTLPYRVQRISTLMWYVLVTVFTWSHWAAIVSMIYHNVSDPTGAGVLNPFLIPASVMYAVELIGMAIDGVYPKTKNMITAVIVIVPFVETMCLQVMIFSTIRLSDYYLLLISMWTRALLCLLFCVAGSIGSARDQGSDYIYFPGQFEYSPGRVRTYIDFNATIPSERMSTTEINEHSLLRVLPPYASGGPQIQYPVKVCAETKKIMVVQKEHHQSMWWFIVHAEGELTRIEEPTASVSVVVEEEGASERDIQTTFIPNTTCYVQRVDYLYLKGELDESRRQLIHLREDVTCI